MKQQKQSNFDHLLLQFSFKLHKLNTRLVYFRFIALYIPTMITIYFIILNFYYLMHIYKLYLIILWQKWILMIIKIIF